MFEPRTLEVGENHVSSLNFSSLVDKMKTISMPQDWCS